MREVYIDLSDDKCLPVFFAGHIGEHNATKVIIRLPDRMLTNDINKYQFVIKNSKNEIQSDSFVELSDINNGNISTILTKEQTIGDYLLLNVVATVEKNGVVIRRAKTPIVSLKVKG